MADWHLSFRGAQVLGIAGWEQLVAAAVGPVTTTYGEWTGNPRDFYSRPIAIAGRRDDVRVVVNLLEDRRGPGDPEQRIAPNPSATLYASAAPFATRLATWHALRDVFATIGCVDATLLHQTSMIDDAEAAGETAVAERLRAEAKAAVLAEAPGYVLSLRSLRAADLETVLAAHAQPELVRTLSLTSCTVTAPTSLARFPNVVSLALDGMRADDVDLVLAAHPRPAIVEAVAISNCKLSAVPARLAELANLETLFLCDLAPDVPALRGLSFPKLALLTLGGLRALRRDDVAGCPRLALLGLEACPLDELDLGIIDVCPNLHRVLLAGTPFSKDAQAMEALYAAWPTVSEITPRRRARRRVRR